MRKTVGEALAEGAKKRMPKPTPKAPPVNRPALKGSPKPPSKGMTPKPPVVRGTPKPSVVPGATGGRPVVSGSRNTPPVSKMPPKVSKIPGGKVPKPKTVKPPTGKPATGSKATGGAKLAPPVRVNPQGQRVDPQNPSRRVPGTPVPRPAPKPAAAAKKTPPTPKKKGTPATPGKGTLLAKAKSVKIGSVKGTDAFNRALNRYRRTHKGVSRANAEQAAAYLVSKEHKGYTGKAGLKKKPHRKWGESRPNGTHKEH